MSERTLYLFNPDSDLALANGNAHYMPPASARRMASDLALLPAWYAEPGSAILASSAYNLPFLKEMQEHFPLAVTLITEPEASGVAEFLHPVPWGWNPAIRKRCLLLGIPESRVPSVVQLKLFRHLSHRQRAVELLPKLQQSAFFCGKSVYLTSALDWQRFVESHEACLLKAPLSGSGKGLNWCRGEFTSFVSGWCARVAALQGGVVAEPIYNKVADFAMEFCSDGAGQVVFAGYSLFATGAGGAYEGNCLLSDEAIEQRLSEKVPRTALQALRQQLEAELSLLIGSGYAGCLGVDMMICHFPDESPEFRIHPCVEINLRMSMGMVARRLYDRYLPSGIQGIFRVEYHASSSGALMEHERMKARYPLQIEEGKMVAGYLPLVPVTAQSQYRVWLLLHSRSGLLP